MAVVVVFTGVLARPAVETNPEMHALVTKQLLCPLVCLHRVVVVMSTCLLAQGGGSTNCTPCKGSGMVEKQPPHHHGDQDGQQQQHWVERVTCNVCRGAGREK